MARNLAPGGADATPRARQAMKQDLTAHAATKRTNTIQLGRFMDKKIPEMKVRVISKRYWAVPFEATVFNVRNITLHVRTI